MLHLTESDLDLTRFYHFIVFLAMMLNVIKGNGISLFVILLRDNSFKMTALWITFFFLCVL